MYLYKFKNSLDGSQKEIRKESQERKLLEKTLEYH